MDPITIVSGLPRSGTSMMMQVLQAGGLALLTDARRAPDDSNPRGYHELEAVKHLAADDSILDDATGKAVKIIHHLVSRLPARHRYRVLFMRRAIDQVIASQHAMLQRLGKSSPLSDPQLSRELEKQRDRALHWLQAQPNVTLLQVDHAAMITSPAQVCAAVNRFLGGDLDERAMAAAVDRSLHRQRG